MNIKALQLICPSLWERLAPFVGKEKIQQKSLSHLLLVCKKANFKEEEHPRNAHGEFRNKSEGAGLKKTTVEHVDETHEIPVEPKEAELTEEQKQERKIQKQKATAQEKHKENMDVLLGAAVLLAFAVAYNYGLYRLNKNLEEEMLKNARKYGFNSHEEYYRHTTNRFRREWEETWQSRAGGGRTNSYSNYDTGPKFNGNSVLYKKIEPIKDTAKLTIDQIKKGVYDKSPVPKDAMTIATMLKRFNEKLKIELRGKSKDVTDDIDKTSEELEKLIKENWAKHGVKEGAAAKGFMGLDLELITKEMTAEQFEESEHPRAPKGSDHGGEFTSKNEPTPEGGTWGGARKNAGRMAKDPIAAKQKLETRLRADNPNASDTELHQKMVDYATENRNADLLYYLKDPVGYQKKREQEILTESAAKTRIKDRKERIPTSEETGKVYADLKTTKTEWDREVKKHQDFFDAIKVFEDEHASSEDKYHAKLVIAAASIATLVGIGVIAARWPKLGKPGLRFAPGAETAGARTLHAGTADPLGVEGKYFNWGTLIDESLPELKPAQRAGKPTAKYQREVDLLGWLTSRVLPKTKEGERQFVEFGPGLRGYLGKFRLGEYFPFLRDQDFKPMFGDSDIRTGLRIVEGTKEKPIVNKINLAIARFKIPDHPGDTHRFPQRYKSMWGDSEYPPGLTKGHNNMWEFKDVVKPEYVDEAGKTIPEQIIKGETAFDHYLSEVGLIHMDKAGKIEVPPAQFPLKMARMWEAAKKDAHTDFDAAAEMYRGVFHFFDKQMVGPISLRTLSMLTATASLTGSGETIYYFQKDIEKYLSSYLKHEEEQQEGAKKIGKKPGDYSAEMQLEKQKEKTAKAQGTRADKQRILELQRENVITQLVKLGARRWEEGARTEKTLTEEILRRHLTVPMLDEAGYSNTDAGWSEFKDDLLNGREKGTKLLDAVMDKAILEDIEKAKKQEPLVQADEGTDAELNAQDRETLRQAQEAHDKKKKSKKKEFMGLSYLITKAFETEEKTPLEDLNYFDKWLTLLAEEIATQISDISQSCKVVIQSGMPGAEKFVALNNMVNEIYGYLRDRSKNASDKMITEKSFTTPMSSQSDAGGGLLVGSKVCKKCSRLVTEEMKAKCKREDCPDDTFLSEIREKE